MEIQFASKFFFTFEAKAPKIVQEKRAAFPPRMENRFASNLFSHLKRMLKFVHKNGQHFPSRMEHRCASNLFSLWK